MTTCTEWKCRKKARWAKVAGWKIYYFCDEHKKCAKRYNGKRLERLTE